MVKALFFDFLIPLFALVLMGGVRLYFVLDDVDYWLAERIARPIVRRAPFAVGFLAAFAVEIVLVRGAVGFWCTWRTWRRACWDFWSRPCGLLADELIQRLFTRAG